MTRKATLPFGAGGTPPTYEVYVILDGAHRRLSEERDLICSLGGIADESLLGVNLHYRRSTDTALFGLRFDARTLMSLRLAHLLGSAAQAGASVLQTARLD